MAIAQRRSVPTPVAERGAEQPRAKALRPFERGRRALRGSTVEALEAFERAALSFQAAQASAKADEAAPSAREDAYRVLRLAAASAMDALVQERDAGTLPRDLAAEIDRWEEGVFAGTRADVELANYALAELLGSPLRVFAPEAGDDDEPEAG